MPGLRINVNSPILPILTLKFVVMATFLEPMEKGGQIGNLQSKPHLPYGENVVKISPIDPEICLLKSLFKKERK